MTLLSTSERPCYSLTWHLMHRNLALTLASSEMHATCSQKSWHLSLDLYSGLVFYILPRPPNLLQSPLLHRVTSLAWSNLIGLPTLISWCLEQEWNIQTVTFPIHVCMIRLTKEERRGGGPNQKNVVHLVYTFVLNIKVFSFASIWDFDTWTDTIRKVSRLLHLFHSVYLRRQWHHLYGMVTQTFPLCILHAVSEQKLYNGRPGNEATAMCASHVHQHVRSLQA